MKWQVCLHDFSIFHCKLDIKALNIGFKYHIRFSFRTVTTDREMLSFKDIRLVTILLLVGGVQQAYSRSHGIRRDDICDDVDPGTLVIKDDVESCGTYIACVGQVAQRFKCLNDKLYSNGTSVCLTCDENIDEYYEDDNGYGPKKTTKKKYTYKQTRRTKPSQSKKYGKPTRPPPTRAYPSRTTSAFATYTEQEITDVNNFTISFASE